MTADIALIAAVSDNGVLGLDNELPWRLPGDLEYFQRMTLGKPVIMGRGPWASIGPPPLPGRTNIVLSRSADTPHEGALLAADFDGALALLEVPENLGDAEEIMVIGGSAVYAMALPLARRLYMTEVHTAAMGDTWFPEWDRGAWTEVSRERRAAGPDDSCDYSFVVYERR